ncbi:hypothetical protein HanIR_Chr02g0069001 [Helianthus annuus]|nr:hypothetical protein HanIR_Chr02g0069001 [Helianthus annuus]
MLTGFSKALCEVFSIKSVFDSSYSPISQGRSGSFFSHNFLSSLTIKGLLLFSTVPKPVSVL